MRRTRKTRRTRRARRTGEQGPQGKDAPDRSKEIREAVWKDLVQRLEKYKAKDLEEIRRLRPKQQTQGATNDFGHAHRLEKMERENKRRYDDFVQQQ